MTMTMAKTKSNGNDNEITMKMTLTIAMKNDKNSGKTMTINYLGNIVHHKGERDSKNAFMSG
jgi:hypothetical protein